MLILDLCCLAMAAASLWLLYDCTRESRPATRPAWQHETVAVQWRQW